MKRAHAWLLSLFLAVSAWPLQAAPVISVERTGSAAIGIGSSVTFELHVSGLTEPLGAFGFDLLFDPAVLAFQPAVSAAAQFGDRLGQLDTEAIGFAQVSAPGLLRLDEVSLLDTLALDALQRDAGGQRLDHIVLALVSFQGLAAGVSSVAIDPTSLVLSDAAGQVLAGALLVPSAVAVVPEAATSWLLAAAAVAWVAVLRRRRRPGQVVV